VSRALERLQKAIARSGFASRRKAEELIAAGRVTVDGGVARLGDKVDPHTSRIAVDGAQVPVRPGMVYYLLNKPAGVISSVSDPQGRPVVIDLVPEGPRVWPVGRLDLDSEGLLILTNDGDLTDLLTHPRNRVPKRYSVLVEGNPDGRTVAVLVQGVKLEDGWASAEDARVVDRTRDRTLLEVVMTEGRKREVRRMCAALGMPVLHLFRSAIGPISDAALRPGRWRLLSPSEVVALYALSGPSDTPAVTPVIAIDGPGGSGKTTVSRRVADVLGLAVLDTGAFYRTATLAVLRAGVDLDTPEASAVVAGSRFEMVEGAMTLDGEDVGEKLRRLALGDVEQEEDDGANADHRIRHDRRRCRNGLTRVVVRLDPFHGH